MILIVVAGFSEPLDMFGVPQNKLNVCVGFPSTVRTHMKVRVCDAKYGILAGFNSVQVYGFPYFPATLFC
jgi:hypothetical protein